MRKIPGFKFWPVTIFFSLGAAILIYLGWLGSINYWVLIFWLLIFLIIQFFGSYFIGLDFHLNSLNNLKGNARTVILTFDDGPHPKNTPRVLDVLRQYNVKALFFIIGKNIRGNEDLVKQIISEGHRIGNHSFSHHGFIDLWPVKKVTNDFAKCQMLIDGFQSTQKIARPPYGVTTPNLAKAFKKLGLISIGWSIRSYDTNITNIQKIQKRIMSKLKPGAIILLHDRLAYMPELLNSIIPEIEKQGYTIANPVNTDFVSG